MLFLFLGFVAAPHRAAAEAPLAVDLLYFQGEGGDNRVFLEWETGTESDTAGFRLERGASATGPFIELEEIGFIPARGSVAAGATYQATDETALNGQTYWYKLVEITTATTVGNEWLREVAVTPEATAQIIGGGGSSSTNTPVPTSTREATATSRPPTNTPVSSPTRSESNDDAAPSPTPRPSNTPRPTNTRQPTVSALPDQGDDEAVATRTFTVGATATTGPGDDEMAAATAIAAADTPEAGVTAPAALPAGEVEREQSEAESALAASEAEAAAGTEEDAPLLGGRTIGADDEAEADTDSAAAQAAEESSSLLLWLGFLAALFIFVGGVAFSIYLSTRKRRNDLS